MNIDKHVKEIIEKENDITRIRQSIINSSKEMVIVFLDLCDSTKLKMEVDTKDWLVYIYKFIETLSAYTRKFNGTVVKRIGDELMLTFDSVSDCESFIDFLHTDNDDILKLFRFKLAIDYGTIFYFKFEKNANNDPYGTTVDRCARIAKLCKENIVLCGSKFVEKSGKKDKYYSVGKYHFKGITEPEEVYISCVNLTCNQKPYLDSIINKLNDSNYIDDGYRYISRQFKHEDFQLGEDQVAKPFLLRELIKFPKLPHSYIDFLNIIKSTREDEYNLYYGYLVEWEGYFESLAPVNGYKLAFIKSTKEITGGKMAALYIPKFMSELIKDIPKNKKIRFRGIITSINLSININYVDFEHVSES